MTVLTNCKKDIAVTGVKLDETFLTLEVGEYQTLIATVFPENATNRTVTWTSSNLDIVIVANGKVCAKKMGTATISVTTEDGNYEAKCVISVEREEIGVVISGVRWATRSLATHGKFVKNPEDYGALFQWGRVGDGHEQRTSQNYPTNDESEENGMVGGSENFDTYGQIVNTHPAYGKFIKQNVPPYDWRYPSSATIWNSGSTAVPVKTANDPCPNGWRVPTHTELASLGYGEWIETPAAGRRFGSDDNLLFLPAAGGHTSYNGKLSGVGTDGIYWSSTPEYHEAYYLYFTNSYVNPNLHIYRAYGFSVRCVAEH